MSTNLYSSHGILINSGTFWRCRHGITSLRNCWKCGVWHPFVYWKYVQLEKK